VSGTDCSEKWKKTVFKTVLLTTKLYSRTFGRMATNAGIGLLPRTIGQSLQFVKLVQKCCW